MGGRTRAYHVTRTRKGYLFHLSHQLYDTDNCPRSAARIARLVLAVVPTTASVYIHGLQTSRG